MENIVIIGAGGMGRDIQWLLERINTNDSRYKLLGYIDDNVKPGTMVDGFPVIGSLCFLREYEKPLNAVCSVAAPAIRKLIIEKIKENRNLKFPNLIDPSVCKSDFVDMGIGNVICAQNVISLDVILGDFNLVCCGGTIGHDDRLHSYVTLYPGVNVSGNVEVGEGSEVGTGSCIIQGVTVGQNATIGAGSVVIRNIPSDCVAVGNPAKPIKVKD